MNRKFRAFSFLVISILTLSLVQTSMARAEGEAPPESVPEETADDLSVPEILEATPEGTEIVVIDSEGQPEPLVTHEASEIIANSDPVWCPAAAAPGDSACTPNQLSVTALIAYLLDPDGDPGTPTPFTGAGTIYFQDGLYGGAEPLLDFDHSVLAELSDLKLEGGWDLSTNFKVLDGVTTFNTPMSINWFDTFDMEDILINADYSGYSLEIAAEDDVSLTNVDVVNNDLGSGARIDTCTIGDVNPDPAIEVLGCLGDSGAVAITGSQFDTNLGTGLSVQAASDINLLLVEASGNGLTGAALDNCVWGDLNPDPEVWEYGCAGSGNVSIGTSDFEANDGDGLYIDTAGSVSADHIYANDNLGDGAEISAVSGISLTAAEFNNNGWDGLYSRNGIGNINLTSITSIGNTYGVTAITGEGDVTVAGGLFADNTFPGASWDTSMGIGLLAESGTGNVSLTNITALQNDIGAIAAAHDGDVVVDQTLLGHVSENTFVGLGVYSELGNIQLTDVVAGYYYDLDADEEFLGNGDIGAWLMTNSGTITVEGGFFDQNGSIGLKIESGGAGTDPDVALNNVQASENVYKGAYIYYAAPCGTTTGGVNVNVVGGLYQTNGAYGIYAMAGPDGDLVYDSDAIFGTHNGNPPDSLYDLVINTDVIPCPPPCEPEPKSEPKPYNMVEIPATGGLPVEQDCAVYGGTLLVLPDQNKVYLHCPATGSVLAEELTLDGLPGLLPGGPTFMGALEISLMDGDIPIPVITNGGYITVAFKLPEDILPGETLAVLYWDPTGNNGAGAWLEMPGYEELFPGRSKTYPLHPNLEPDDLMRILSGARSLGGYLKLNVNFPGVFVLIKR